MRHTPGEVTPERRPSRARESWSLDGATGRVTVVSSLGELTFNPSGTLIWQRCDGRRSVRDIAEELSELTGSRASEILADAQSFVSDLTELGLLYVYDPALAFDDLPLLAHDS